MDVGWGIVRLRMQYGFASRNESGIKLSNKFIPTIFSIMDYHKYNSLATVSVALQHEWHNVGFFSDSKIVIQSIIKSNSFSLWKMYVPLKTILANKDTFSMTIFIAMSMNFNGFTHDLAKFSLNTSFYVTTFGHNLPISNYPWTKFLFFYQKKKKTNMIHLGQLHSTKFIRPQSIESFISSVRITFMEEAMSENPSQEPWMPYLSTWHLKILF